MDWKQRKQSWPLEPKSSASGPVPELAERALQLACLHSAVRNQTVPHGVKRSKECADARRFLACDAVIGEEYGNGDPSDPLSTKDGRAGHARV